MNLQFSRIDLHVHSRYSDDADNGYIKLLKAKECYTAPEEVYHRAKKRGMDFVTLTDHDTIEGALQLQHYPDFLPGEEITAFFPEDGAKVHVVALNITESQHHEFSRLRHHIYDLVAFLNQENIPHFIAHPFFRMNRQLSIEHFEKMLLLFKAFEVKNGGKALVPDALLTKILSQLTPERLWQLAEKHDLMPVGERPWIKTRVAGSDDHGGIFIGMPHTRFPKATSISELLSFLKQGQCHPEGHGGSALNVAHSIQSVVFQYAKSRRIKSSAVQSDLIRHFLGMIFENNSQDPVQSRVEKAFLFTTMAVKNVIPPKKSPMKQMLRQIVREVKRDPHLLQFLKQGVTFSHETNIRFFNVIDRLCNQTIRTCIDFDSQQSKSRVLQDKLKLAAGLVLLMIPYFASAKTESRDRDLMYQAQERFLSSQDRTPFKTGVLSNKSASALPKSAKLKSFLPQEFISGHEWCYFGVAQSERKDEAVHDFAAVTSIRLPWGNARYDLPPILQVVHHLIESNARALYVHDFGPMTLLAAFMGPHVLCVPSYARYPYHQIRQLLEAIPSPETREIITRILAFVYRQFHQVRVISRVAYEHAIALGIPGNLIKKSERHEVVDLLDLAKPPSLFWMHSMRDGY